jgi:NADH-quinone oxidoreductase subunit G
MSTDLIKVTINGKDFHVPKGARLIDVCRENQFDIPSFCYYSDLALQASCRMCLVRIEKMPKLQTSCTITCTDGMVVTTQTDEIEKAQRSMLEFLLANHPLDCPVCDRGGECELQEMTFDWGGLEERFAEPKNVRAEKYLSPMVANDPQRCILCKRCTRVCDEWMGEDAIEAGGRGAGTVIGTYGGWLNCSQCGNCIEVCPTGTLLDGTYRHQTRPWELSQTVSTCSFCSDGCEMSLGSRAGELMRVVARDRYVNGHNGEFLCIKGRFGHPFVNHEERIRTPLIRYKKGGKLIPATWDEALRYTAEKLGQIQQAHGASSVGVIGSPRLTNESLFVLRKFASEVLRTEKIAGADAFSLQSFFENLGGSLATHKDIRHAATIVLIGGEPEELQPFTAKQIRQAVRNGGAKLVVINKTPIRLKQQATQFIHILPGSENAAVLALADPESQGTAAAKMGIAPEELDLLLSTVINTEGNVIFMFGGELSESAMALVAQFPDHFAGEGRSVSLHPLPLYNNSVGLHDMGFMKTHSVANVLAGNDDGIRALYVAGSLLPEQIADNRLALENLEFVVVQELFETETTEFADVVLPAASFAEVDGTYTNNDGFVQRVRQSIPPVHLSRADWVITSQLASEMGADFGYQMAATAVFKDLASNIPAYAELRYPLLKDEHNPVQVKHAVVGESPVETHMRILMDEVSMLSETGEKNFVTPDVGHELFKTGTLTSKVAQFHLLEAGNPEPPSVSVSPLYQITLDPLLRRSEAVSGD